MKKFLNPKILMPTVVTLLLSGMVAYILLAPETWWKPIYIQFGAEEVSANTNGVQVATPEDHIPEITPPAESSYLKPTTNIAPQLVMPAIQPGQGVMYQLEPKVVNLAEPGGLRYLQAGVVLEFHPTVKEYYLAKMSGETDTNHRGEGEVTLDPFQEAMDAMRPVIDDIVTTILSSKTFNEISTIEGKQALKQELMVKINAALGYQGVVNIYFTEFVVQ